MRNIRWIIWLIVVALLALFPLFGVQGLLFSTMLSVAMFAGLSMATDLVIGYLGELSFGQTALFAVGAYAAAKLSLTGHVPFPTALVLSILISAAFGLVIGAISLRLTGPFFAMVTFGMAGILSSISNNWIAFTGGSDGLPGIPPAQIGSLTFSSQTMYWYMILAICIIIYAVSRGLLAGRTGRAILSTRDNPNLATSLGIRIFRYKLLTFVVSSALCGLVGVFYAYSFSYVSPDLFGFYFLEMTLSMVIIGGKGTLVGPVVGSIILTFVSNYVQLKPEWNLIIFGAITILALIFFPKGIVPASQSLISRLNKTTKTRPRIGDQHERETGVNESY